VTVHLQWRWRALLHSNVNLYLSLNLDARWWRVKCFGCSLLTFGEEPQSLNGRFGEEKYFFSVLELGKRTFLYELIQPRSSYFSFLLIYSRPFSKFVVKGFKMITLTWDEMCQSRNSDLALTQMSVSHLTVGCYAVTHTSECCTSRLTLEM
jgi:hypothetical protein